MGTTFYLDPSATTRALGPAYLLVSNHIGLAKAVKIAARDLHSPGPSAFLNDEPFMLLWAGLHQAVTLVSPTHLFRPVQLSYPDLGGVIQNAYHAVVLPVGASRLDHLSERLTDDFQRSARFCWGFMPEGRTSSKRSLRFRHDALDQFHSGAFVLAARFGMPILPVVQSLSKDHGHVVTVLAPLTALDNGPTSVAHLMSQTREVMAATLRTTPSSGPQQAQQALDPSGRM
ncbi:MAG: hypothetical protein FWD59_06185 [Micrococcales bacterium]|nr:hypothetical protein [Micrococcales bacterium]